jgi:hypothetical protein
MHVQKEIWKKHNTNVLRWAFYCVNDGKDVESENLYFEMHPLLYKSCEWLGDLKIDCKPPSSLLELIEKKLHFEELKSLKVHFNIMNLCTYKMLKEEKKNNLFWVFFNF